MSIIRAFGGGRRNGGSWRVRPARRIAPLLLCSAGLCGASPVAAQSVPTIDTEDADLGSLRVGGGRFHPSVSVDLRNGDFARGSYDDDAASLDRLPAHIQIGFGYDLHRGADGKADAWIVGSSSNGLHAAAPYERTSPRAWYESNNLLGVVIAPTEGLKAGLVYTIKTSPNGVSDTTHEASATFAYEADKGIGLLHPSFAATVRPKGGHGLFTQAGIEPEFDLAKGDAAPKLSIPLKAGIGWGGFYEAGTGRVAYGSVGLACSVPFDVGATKWRLRAEGLALIRDDTLRHLGSADAETGTVVPLVTVSLAVAY